MVDAKYIVEGTYSTHSVVTPSVNLDQRALREPGALEYFSEDSFTLFVWLRVFEACSQILNLITPNIIHHKNNWQVIQLF